MEHFGDDPTDKEAIRAFLTLFRYLRRQSRQIHESGHSGRRLSTLRYLLDNGPATMGTLSSYLYIGESSTTELVSKLEVADLVERNRSPSDNRVVEVGLTNEGRRIAETTALGGIPLLRDRLKGLSGEELRSIRDTFRRLNQLLDIEEEP